MKISNNFKLEEFTESSIAVKYGIRNYPNEEETKKIKMLVTNILQPIRDKFKKSIFITSGFRNQMVNKYAKGSPTSQHMKGEAADITCEDNLELFNLIVKMIEDGEIEVGQLIWEGNRSDSPSWIHISLPYRKKNDILYFKG